jgi:poly(ADP-ribose) glycohydrolase ARH3
MPSAETLCDRFKGCLLGLAVGDALGGRFEGQTADWIAYRYPSPEALIAQPPEGPLSYTDDTQMAIGVAETLAEHLEIHEGPLCEAFSNNYMPWRGYGQGARRVLEAMQEGNDYKAVAAGHFRGGSYGNGAAMRVAPVGVFFHEDLDKVWEQARLSALPTHVHPLGIEGARLLAVAAALCLRSESFDRAAFFAELLGRCQSDEYRAKLAQAANVESVAALERLGNGIQALESAPTAIACFALSPNEYATAIARAVLLGGDTDTIAAMTGALAGAFLGAKSIPAHLVQALENIEELKGRSYIERLADKLFHASAARSAPG